MKGSSCLFIILLLISLVIVGIILSFYILSNQFIVNYKKTIAQHCENEKVEWNKTFIPFTTKYQPENAAMLNELCYNVTRMNCPDMKWNKPSQFDITTPITGISPNNNSRNLYGYALSSKSLDVNIIAFTGTFSIDEWESDFDFKQVVLGNGKVHRGFNSIYTNVKDAIRKFIQKNPKKMLIVTGHSLGGALAVLGSYDLADLDADVVMYSFASPRVGNNEFVNNFNSKVKHKYRVYNTSDIIPTVPFPVMKGDIYTHVDNGIPFTLNLGSDTRNHIQAYTIFLN